MGYTKLMLSILDLLFPRRCVSCRKFGSFFCQGCIQKLKTVADVCPVCEKPAVFGETHKYCRTALSLDGLTSVFLYSDPIKQAIHRFKYKPFIENLAPILVKLMVDNLEQNKGFLFFIKKKPTLVPIPLHWWRKHLRGYNQTELLVKGLSFKLNLSAANILLRRKLSKPQSELSYKKRKENVAGIFSYNPEFNNKIPQGVILVDDIWTTGSTLKSACLVLKRKGVNSIWALTLAR